ncbi:MAG: hypothetical protein P4M11_09010 [Candidatus Pacebacteria bacterium]|nr:hypothetical protein [Candidatus Paceibacterota bacterium]
MDFATKFKTVSQIKPGFLIIGEDGKHCAVVDKEGDKFVHVNPNTKKVALTPLSRIGEFFKDGYIVKDYSDC